MVFPRRPRNGCSSRNSRGCYHADGEHEDEVEKERKIARHTIDETDGERTINNSTDLAMYLLEVGHVATVGGDAFGDPECFRMSYATSDDNIREAMRRIKDCLSRLH